jgi:hypothetical protein
VGQSIPKNGIPSMTLADGTADVYCSMVVLSLNMVLVRGETEDPSDSRFSWYSITKNASTAGANALML